MEEIYLRGFPKSTNLWGSFDLSCVQNQFLDADTPNYLQNHPPSWLYPLLMIYLQKLNIRIQYIPYMYIPYIYPIYIPYISHIYPIYIPYIPRIISYSWDIPQPFPRSPRSRFPHAQTTSACRSGASDPGDPLGCWEQHGFFWGKYHGQTIIIYHIYLILDIIWDDRYLL